MERRNGRVDDESKDEKGDSSQEGELPEKFAGFNQDWNDRERKQSRVRFLPSLERRNDRKDGGCNRNIDQGSDCDRRRAHDRHPGRLTSTMIVNTVDSDSRRSIPEIGG